MTSSSSPVPVPASRSSACSRVAIRVPAYAGENQEPASSRRTSSRVRSATRHGGAAGEDPRGVGGAAELGVVGEDQGAVAGALDVDLDQVGTELDGLADRGEGVLRGVGAGAAVGDGEDR